MGRTSLALFALVLVLPPLSAQAAAADGACQPKSYSDFVRCLGQNSIDIRLSDQRLQAARKLEDAASQLINPDLEADTSWKGGDTTETTASLLFMLRLGGKRSALINEARSEIAVAQATRDTTVQQTRLEVMLALYRLNHLKSEIALSAESVDTFNKLTNQYQKRPALTPEQEISLNVFKLALADNQLRLTQLQADEEKTYQVLSASTGLSRESIAASLPARKASWETVSVSGQLESAPQFRQAAAEVKLAKDQKEVADSNAWPDLRIGPTVRTSTAPGERNSFVGVGFTMPIPSLSFNGGNRAYRAERVAEAEVALERSKRSLVATRNELVNRYNRTVASLKATPNVRTLSDKHEQVEKQFLRGLVPSALIIEAHRQLLDFEVRRNASELEALDAYGQLMILDNKMNEVIL